MDSDETFHLVLQCLPSSLRFFNMVQFILKGFFRNFADGILLSAFMALYELNEPSTRKNEGIWHTYPRQEEHSRAGLLKQMRYS